MAACPLCGIVARTDGFSDFEAGVHVDSLALKVQSKECILSDRLTKRDPPRVPFFFAIQRNSVMLHCLWRDVYGAGFNLEEGITR
jgi:hypothetical protein